MRFREVGRWSGLLLAVLVHASCSVPARTGWEAQLRGELVDVADRFDVGAKILSGFAPLSPEAMLSTGDELLFGVSLENGDRSRTWYLRLRVVALEIGHGLQGRQQTAFERRVKPHPERARRIHEEQLAAWQAFQQMEPGDFRKFECARICVDAFDADAQPLASAETTVVLASLQDIHAACLAGSRQQSRMRGRVALGDEADMLELDDNEHVDVMRVADGVGSCRLLFRLLQTNPVTRDIFYEVIALPTLWSIVSTMRIRAGMTADFFAAERVESSTYPTARRPLWSVPVTVLLNKQPALYAFLIAGPDGAPDGAAAGVFGIVGRHPTDERRRVFVQLLASRCAGREK